MLKRSGGTAIAKLALRQKVIWASLTHYANFTPW